MPACCTVPSAARLFQRCFTDRDKWTPKKSNQAEGKFPSIPMQMGHICVCVCMCVRVSTYVSTCVCVCFVGVCTSERGRFGPPGDDKTIKLYVSHINCFDLFFFFFSLSDSWLNGNEGHFTQLERVLKSAKYEEMAGGEINSSKCLPSTGTKRTALFSGSYALPISQKNSFFFFFKSSSRFDTVCS